MAVSVVPVITRSFVVLTPECAARGPPERAVLCLQRQEIANDSSGSGAWGAAPRPYPDLPGQGRGTGPQPPHPVRLGDQRGGQDLGLLGAEVGAQPDGATVGQRPPGALDVQGHEDLPPVRPRTGPFELRGGDAELHAAGQPRLPGETDRAVIEG